MDKHLRSLVKLLRDSIAKCSDPKVIEHNQKQIKAIEGLLEEVKVAISNREFKADASRLIESLFLLSSESLKDVQTSAILSDKERAFGLELESNTIRLANNKRKKITMDHEMEGFIQESKLGNESNAKENRHLNPGHTHAHH